jgi:hypothetical protein
MYYMHGGYLQYYQSGANLNAIHSAIVNHTVTVEGSILEISACTVHISIGKRYSMVFGSPHCKSACRLLLGDYRPPRCVTESAGPPPWDIMPTVPQIRRLCGAHTEQDTTLFPITNPGPEFDTKKIFTKDPSA